jgi:hypothetical protein
LSAICIAVPAVPVAVKFTELPVSPAAVAVSVFGPAVPPSVHDVTAAIPLALVVTAVAGFTVPPPEVTANVTLAPGTGLLNWSRTITDGFVGTAVFTVAAWAFPAFTAIELGAAAFTTTAGCCAMAKPPTVAATVFVPDAVELSVPIATPFTSVGVAGLVSVFAVPIAVNVTVLPLITLPY